MAAMTMPVRPVRVRAGIVTNTFPSPLDSSSLPHGRGRPRVHGTKVMFSF
jgi:hypothetical protein